MSPPFIQPRETKQPVPLLDLHGLQKRDALAAVTRFLEVHHNSHGQVCIVTGTGSHSQRGPVLRTAVDDLLKRRHMQYQRDTPGSFLVSSGTGTMLFRQACTDEDTKLIIRERTGDNFSLTTHRKRLQRKETNTAAPGLLQLEPTLSEVVRHDTALKAAQAESVEMHRMKQKEIRKQESTESLELDRAVELSLLNHAVIEDDPEFEHAVQLALELSKTIKTSAEEDFFLNNEQHFVSDALKSDQQRLENDIEFVLLQSELEFQREQMAEEQILNEALLESIRLDEESARTMEEEEQILQKILALSLESS